VTFDKLLRALIGVTLFASAYMAEVVRGGLQAIPKGQYEAASALGLSYWKSMVLIILPQALKIVIPGIVNTFIGLFKDTTLVSIIGIFDLLGIIHSSFADARWASPQTAPTGYFFAARCLLDLLFRHVALFHIHGERLHTGHRNGEVR
jgi:general L-amino acid transport system permease protein